MGCTSSNSQTKDPSKVLENQTSPVDLEGMIWTFAFGTDMDYELLVNFEELKIVDSVVAIAKGWRLAFNGSPITLPLVEPAYVNAIKGEDSDEI